MSTTLSSAKLEPIILNYLLRDRRFMVEASKQLKPEYFTTSSLQMFYGVLLKNFQDPKIKDVISAEAMEDYCKGNDLIAFAAKCRPLYKKLEAVTLGPDKKPPSESDFGYFLKKIKEGYNVRLVQTLSKQINEAGSEGAGAEELNKIIHESLTDINAVNQIEVFDEGSVGEDVASMWEEYVKIKEAPQTFKGVTSGYESLDDITNGFQGSELILIAGMEGTGKSVLMQNMGVNAWLGDNRPGMIGGFTDTGHNILYFTLEMPRSNRGEVTSGGYLNKRILSCVSEVKLEEIRKGKLSDEDQERLKETCDFIEKYSKEKQFYVVDIPRGAKVEDIEAKYLEVHEKIGVDMVIIDYLGIMAGDDDSDWEAQGHIAGGLHEFARSYNVPVLSAVQLNRPQGVQSLDKQKYNNARVARSAMITQNANMVFVIGCRDNEELYPDMPLHITKMRDGRKGQLTLTKSFECMKIIDGSPLSEVEEADEFRDFESLPELDGDIGSLLAEEKPKSSSVDLPWETGDEDDDSETFGF